MGALDPVFRESLRSFCGASQLPAMDLITGRGTIVVKGSLQLLQACKALAKAYLPLKGLARASSRGQGGFAASCIRLRRASQLAR